MSEERKYQSLSDEALLQWYHERQDNLYLGIVLQRHTVLLLGIAFKYLKDKTAAEDATQQVLLHALTHFPKQPVQNLKGWLYIIMRNYCLTVLRKQMHFADEKILSNVPNDETISDKALWQHELQISRMNELMRRLPLEQQTCLQLFYLQNKSYDEVCSATSFTFMQVKSYLQNGKRKLRILMINDLLKRNHD